MSQKLKEKIAQTIEKHRMFAEDAHIVIGLSGGPDSVCLFDVLKEIAKTRTYIFTPYMSTTVSGPWRLMRTRHM